MGRNVISIEKCVITRREGKLYLDLLCEIPTLFELTTLQVTFYKNGDLDKPLLREVSPELLVQKTGTIAYAIDLGFLFGDHIKIDSYGVYHVHLEVGSRTQDDRIEEDIYISDVEFVYHCLVPKLSELCGNSKCVELPDELITQYLLLYGHQLAMQYKDLGTATYLYKKMLNCGNPCPPVSAIDCGCKK